MQCRRHPLVIFSNPLAFSEAQPTRVDPHSSFHRHNLHQRLLGNQPRTDAWAKAQHSPQVARSICALIRKKLRPTAVKFARHAYDELLLPQHSRSAQKKGVLSWTKQHSGSQANDRILKIARTTSNSTWDLENCLSLSEEWTPKCFYLSPTTCRRVRPL